MNHYADYVDPYIGTISYLLRATQPLVHLPHSMAQIRPILDEKINDHYLAPQIHSFPACRGQLMPDVGEQPTFVSAFDHDFEEVKCYKGSVLLEDSGISAEYTVTERCALYRFHYPAEGRALLRFRQERGSLNYADHCVSGTEKREQVPCCFAAELSEKPLSAQWQDGALILEFNKGISLLVKVGFSHIDEAQAMDNLRRETKNLTFDGAAQRARDIWDRALGRIEVEGGTEQEKRVAVPRVSAYDQYQRIRPLLQRLRSPRSRGCDGLLRG